MARLPNSSPHRIYDWFVYHSIRLIKLKKKYLGFIWRQPPYQKLWEFKVWKKVRGTLTHFFWKNFFIDFFISIDASLCDASNGTCFNLIRASVKKFESLYALVNNKNIYKCWRSRDGKNMELLTIWDKLMAEMQHFQNAADFWKCWQWSASMWTQKNYLCQCEM